MTAAQHKVESGDVNDYLRETTDEDFTAKDFRTWIGTLLAATALSALDEPRSDADGRRQAAAAIEVVVPPARQHADGRPCVVRAPRHRRPLRRGRAPGPVAREGGAGRSLVLAEERRLLRVLKEARRRQQRAGPARTRRRPDAGGGANDPWVSDPCGSGR